MIFIGIVIASFVIFLSPTQQAALKGSADGNFGTIGGRIISRSEYVMGIKEARLSHMFRTGEWPGRGGRDWDQQKEAMNRLFLVDQANRMGVQVTDEVAAGQIAEIFQDPKTGTFNQAAYERFLARIQTEEGMFRSDFEQFMRHQVAIQHVMQVAGNSGALVPPREAEARYREANSQLAAQVVVISTSNHLAKITADPAALSQYYSNHLAEYRIPERMRVRYVKFASSNYLAEADALLAANTNLTQLLDQEYQRRGADSFHDAQGNVMTPEAAKADLKEQSRKGVALESARKKANEFANKLYNLDAVPDSLNKLATENSLEVRTSSPFTQFGPPLDMKVGSSDFSKAAWQLTGEEPFATPVAGDDGVYVYAFDSRVPAEYQPFETIKERVADAYKRAEARAQAEAEGKALSATLAGALAQGKTFEAAATEAGHPVVTLTNLSRSTPTPIPGLPPRLSVFELLSAGQKLAVGTATGYTPSNEGGFVMYLQSRNPPPDDEVKQKAPEFRKQLQQMGRVAAFMEWERKQYAATQVLVPGTNGVMTSVSAPLDN